MSSSVLASGLVSRVGGRQTARALADPLLFLAASAVAGDATVELVDPYQIPPPMAHIVVPALLVLFLGYMLIRRAPAEAWLSLGVAAATLAEVNENSLDLNNVHLYQSFFNNRILPLPVSPFDLLFVTATLLSLPLLRSRWREWLSAPQVVALVLLALLGILGAAALLHHRPTYDAARDLRPLLVVPSLLLLAAPSLAGVTASRLAGLVVGVAMLKAAEGWLRMLMVVGVPHQGVHLVFYDTTNNIVVVLGMIVLVLTASRLHVALRYLALTFLAVPLLWSFRRGVLVAAAGLLLAALSLVRTWRARAALVSLSIGFVAVALGMNTVLAVASRLPIDRVTAVPPEAAATRPHPTTAPLSVSRESGPASPSPPRVATSRPPGAAAEAGDIDASNVFRLLDAKNAFLNVAAHPLLGLGPGTDYVVYDDGGQRNSPFLAYAKHTSHVGYLAVALKAGLIGLGLYGAMCLLAVAASWRAGPGRERDILFAAVLLFAILNAVFPLVATIRPAVLLGLLLARLVAWRPQHA